MPTIVAPNEGLPDLLLYVLKSAISGVFGLELGLFVNDVTPDQDTVFADLTEPTWLSYTRFTLDRSMWDDPTIASNHATSSYGATPFAWLNDSSGDDTVYGVFFLDPTAGVLRFVQRFDSGDIRVIHPGDQITYLPKITLTTEP